MLGCCKSLAGREAIWGDPTEGIPVNSLAPVASQSAGVLSAVPGTWSGFPTIYTYQWYKDGVVIPGATEHSYTYVGAGTYKVLVSGVNINGSGIGVFSNNVVI